MKGFDRCATVPGKKNSIYALTSVAFYTNIIKRNKLIAHIMRNKVPGNWMLRDDREGFPVFGLEEQAENPRKQLKG